MGIDLLLRIAGVGMMTWAVSTVLKQAGRDELATLAAIAGCAVALLMVVDVVSRLFTQVQSIFQLY